MIAVPLSLPLCFLSMSTASVTLALVFLSGLSSAAYMTFTPLLRSLLRGCFLALRVLFDCLLFVSSTFAYVFVSCCFYLLARFAPLPGDDVLCWLLLLSVSFCVFSLLLFTERVSSLVSFGSVYLVTTTRFKADQLMVNKLQIITTATHTVPLARIQPGRIAWLCAIVE